MKLKSVLSTGAAAVALLAAGSANAAGYYVGLFGGISTFEDDFSPRIGTTRVGAGTYWIALGAFYDTTSNNATTTTGLGPKYTKNTYVGSTWKTAGGTTNVATPTTTLTLTGALGVGIVYSYATAESLTWNDGVDDGWVVGASLGWDFGTGFRAELELAYRSNDIEGGATERYFTYGNSFTAYAYGVITAQTPVFGFYYYGVIFPTTAAVFVANGTKTGTYGGGTFGAIGPTTTSSSTTISIATSGDIETWSLMANLWYDFNLGDSPITPFIGGGIGLAQLNMDYKAQVFAPFNDGRNPLLTNLTGTASVSSAIYHVDDDDFAFAYQLGAGLGFSLGNGMMLSAQYRYFATGEVQLGTADQVNVNLEAHNFLLGLNIPIGGGM